MSLGIERDALDTLLGGVATEDFARDVWNRRACRLACADKRLTELLSIDTLVPLIRCGRLRAKIASADAHGRHVEQTVEPAQALAALDQQVTLCVRDLHRELPALARFLAGVKAGLGVAGEHLTSAYHSTHDGGFGLHFDDSHVFVIQVAGAKRWKHSEGPALRDPPSNVVADAIAGFRARHPWAELHVPDEAQLQQTELLPGDVLYLPPGTWHRGRAVAHSLAITLSFAPRRFDHYVEQFMRKTLIARESFREHTPLSPWTRPASVREEELDAFLARQLAALRDALDRLQVGDLRELYLNELGRLPVPASQAVVPQTLPPLLRVEQRIPVRFAAVSERGAAQVHFLNTSFRVASDSLPLLSWVLEQTTLRVEQVLERAERLGVDEPNARLLLAILVRVGVAAAEESERNSYDDR